MCLCYCVKGGFGGRIIVHTAITGLSLLLSTDEEKSLAAVKVKGQLIHNCAIGHDNNNGQVSQWML